MKFDNLKNENQFYIYDAICSSYEKAYPKASKFMENADEKLKKIIDKLNNDEWETLRDRFVDFYVHCHNVLCMSSGTCTRFQNSIKYLCHCLYTVLATVIY